MRAKDDAQTQLSKASAAAASAGKMTESASNGSVHGSADPVSVRSLNLRAIRF